MFYIRADGNEKIGAGHLMRCLTIAGELLKRMPEQEIRFVCADELSAEFVRRHGFSAEALGTDGRCMETELPGWERLVRESADSRPAILADSYYVTDAYLEKLRSLGAVALMDDLGARAYPADLVINYNAPADEKKYEELYLGTGTRLLLGSAYVPLREQFLCRTYRLRERVRSVLITVGGGDEDNIAGKLLEAVYDRQYEFHLVAGQFNTHFPRLKGLEEIRENLHVHSNVTDMAGLMAGADIAFTAGGSTVYELSALGVPLICFSCAENQEPLTEYIGSRDIAGFAGAYHRAPGEMLERAAELFRKLSADGRLRERYHGLEREMVDGKGAVRLAEALAEFAAIR